MPDLSSVIPAPRFAATMEHYLIKTWTPKEIFFEKSSGQNSLLDSRGEPVPLHSQRAEIHQKKMLNLEPDNLTWYCSPIVQLDCIRCNVTNVLKNSHYLRLFRIFPTCPQSRVSQHDSRNGWPWTCAWVSLGWRSGTTCYCHWGRGWRPGRVDVLEFYYLIFSLRVVITLTEGITYWISRFHSRVSRRP